MELNGDHDYVESVVCQLSDLRTEAKSEEMKEVNVGESGKCLLIRHETGNISAIGHKCTHYGAPLIKGVLANGRIRCPWHGACFNAKTGDIEDFPGVDSIRKFEVTIHNNDVIVRARKSFLNNYKRNDLLEKTHRHASIDNSSEIVDHSVVIVGGGPSSLTCAETLRKEGFSGRIVVVTKDRHPPYDRPKLSKALDGEPANAYLRPSIHYYKDIGVELYNNTEVVSVDVVAKCVKLSKQVGDPSFDKLKYDDLVIATGGEPRTLFPIPGWNLKNVFVLRTPDDANAIAEASKGKNVVVVGSSFIGMEVAAFLASKNTPSSVSVVCGKRSSVPFEFSFGKQVGEVIKKMNEEKGGVIFYPQVGVTDMHPGQEGNSESVGLVQLSDGSAVEADVVVVGIGVIPATQFLKDSEIRLTERGFIPVNGNMQTKNPHVYAVGDVAMFPSSIKGGESINIQHWQMAHTHGRIAANDIIGSLARSKKGIPSIISNSIRPVESVPFFWTVQYGTSIRYAGYGAGYDDIVIRGDLDERKFAAYYLKDNIAVAVATMMADPLASQFAERLISGSLIKRTDIPSSLN